MESDNCDLESFSRENDGLNNGDAPGGRKGGAGVFSVFGFFWWKIGSSRPLTVTTEY